MHGSHQPKGLHDAAEGRLTVGNMLLTTSGRGRPGASRASTAARPTPRRAPWRWRRSG